MHRDRHDNAALNRLACTDVKALLKGRGWIIEDDVAKFGAKLGVSEPVAIALQLCLVTLQRADEVIGMDTDELDWTTRSWVIVSARSKNRRAHHVPLSTLSQVLIRRALALITARSVPEDIDTPCPVSSPSTEGRCSRRSMGTDRWTAMLSRAR
jgi:integrase